jgi:hypothetical protein
MFEMKLSGIVWCSLCALAVGLFAAIIGAGYIALILAEFGVFRLIPCAVFAMTIGTLAGWMAIKRCRLLSRTEQCGWVLAGVIALGSLAMTTPPSEMILGGWDPGVYIHTAAAVANGGSLQIDAQDFTQMPKETKRALSREIPGGWLNPYLGMYLLPNGKLSPQFMHLYPSLMAVAYSIFGVWGALAVNPLLNVLAIGMLYWFASKIVGYKWALVSVLLLTLNPAQIWQAKFSTAEMLTQVLLLGAFGTLIEFTARPPRLMPAALSGAFLGMAFLARYDVVLVIVPMVLLLVALRYESEYQHSIATFLIILTFFGVQAWAHITYIAPCYTPLSYLVFPLLLSSITLTIVLLFVSRSLFWQKAAIFIENKTHILQCILSCTLIGFLIFAWYIRPHLIVDGRILQTMSSCFFNIGVPQYISSMGGANAWNIYYLTSIFGVYPLLLGCVGIVIQIWRIHEKGIAIWLIASVFTMTILVTNVFHDHFMMWVSRRFIPVVIPLVVIGITITAREIVRRFLPARQTLGLFLSAGVLMAVAFTALPNSLVMASSRDWPGLCSWYEHLLKMIPKDAIVYCDQPGFAAPLRFMYGLSAYEFYGNGTLTEFTQKCPQDFSGTKTNVYILTTRQQPIITGVGLQEIGQLTLRSHIQLQPRYTIPRGVKVRGGQFSVYRIILPALETKEPGPTQL